jgi:hypothetical protein
MRQIARDEALATNLEEFFHRPGLGFASVAVISQAAQSGISHHVKGALLAVDRSEGKAIDAKL